MPSSNARKPEATQKDAKSEEKKRLSIAQQAEEACCMEGNCNGPDFEEFALRYNLQKRSDFA